MGRAVRTVLLACLAAAFAALALRLLVAFLEPRAAFFPLRGEQRTPADAGVAFDRVRVETADGETLAAWWLPGRAGAPAVLFFHGNGGNLSLWSDVVLGIHAQGWSVLALDYRGYGLSSGSPTERGLYQDAEGLLLEYWNRRHRSGTRVIYWGRSLGATVAAYAASRRPPDALVLESPIYSARSLVSGHPLMWLPGLFMTYRFETAALLRDFQRPTLVVHGEDDTIVPLAQGRRVFDELPGEKQMVVVPGADHNDLHAARPDLYWQTFRRFIGETVQ